jgi:hypothetical protein
VRGLISDNAKIVNIAFKTANLLFLMVFIAKNPNR